MATLNLIEAKTGRFYFAGTDLPVELAIINDDGRLATAEDAERVEACKGYKNAKVSTRYFESEHDAIVALAKLYPGYAVMTHSIPAVHAND